MTMLEEYNEVYLLCLKSCCGSAVGALPVVPSSRPWQVEVNDAALVVLHPSPVSMGVGAGGGTGKTLAGDLEPKCLWMAPCAMCGRRLFQLMPRRFVSAASDALNNAQRSNRISYGATSKSGLSKVSGRPSARGGLRVRAWARACERFSRSRADVHAPRLPPRADPERGRRARPRERLPGSARELARLVLDRGARVPSRGVGTKPATCKDRPSYAAYMLLQETGLSLTVVVLTQDKADEPHRGLQAPVR